MALPRMVLGQELRHDLKLELSLEQKIELGAMMKVRSDMMSEIINSFEGNYEHIEATLI